MPRVSVMISNADVQLINEIASQTLPTLRLSQKACKEHMKRRGSSDVLCLLFE
jgi:hypothetical protein